MNLLETMHLLFKALTIVIFCFTTAHIFSRMYVLVAFLLRVQYEMTRATLIITFWKVRSHRSLIIITFLERQHIFLAGRSSFWVSRREHREGERERERRLLSHAKYPQGRTERQQRYSDFFGLSIFAPVIFLGGGENEGSRERERTKGRRHQSGFSGRALDVVVVVVPSSSSSSAAAAAASIHFSSPLYTTTRPIFGQK